MSNMIKTYCTACNEMAKFIFNGDDWVCQNCGSYNSQGDYNDSVTMEDYDD